MDMAAGAVAVFKRAIILTRPKDVATVQTVACYHTTTGYGGIRIEPITSM